MSPLFPRTLAGSLIVTVGFCLSGCVVGPDYKGAPQVLPEATAGHFHRAEDAAPAPPPAHWWTTLGDAELDRLEAAAFATSPDLEVATARLRQSRAGLKKSRADLLPNTQASALYLHTKGLTSAFGSGAGAAAASSTGSGSAAASAESENSALEFYDVGFDATWELDLFGGQRRAIESAKAQAKAAQANLEDARVSLSAEVAQAYVSLRDLQQRSALARQNVDVETKILALTKLRRAGGSASDLDVERLNNQLQSTRADAVPLRAQIEEQLDRLAILTGRAPGALDTELSTESPVPPPPAVVAVGDPASLLRRRPDVRAAERQIAQKNALIGQRTADLFPKLEILGNLGFSSTQASSLFDSDSFSYLVAPVLQWRPFDFGRTRASINEAKGERAEALGQYRKTVLGALQDAEIALSRYGRQRESVASLAVVEASAQRAADLTALRVRGGTATTLDQLDAERQRLNAQSGLTQAKARMTQDFVALEKSLGLGWDAS
jgi:NodT family efflux transporter outer membrane factor (OMF) lipoprotein